MPYLKQAAWHKLYSPGTLTGYVLILYAAAMAFFPEWFPKEEKHPLLAFIIFFLWALPTFGIEAMSLMMPSLAAIGYGVLSGFFVFLLIQEGSISESPEMMILAGVFVLNALLQLIAAIRLWVKHRQIIVRYDGSAK
jgi:hypothetical protein